MAEHQGVAHVTLAEGRWSPAAGSNTVRAIMLAGSAASFSPFSAKLQGPFWPVPITMQTFLVLMLAAMLVGTAITLACGIAWLSTLLGLPQAISAGLTPFLLSEAVKIAFATALVPFAWRLLKQS